ncbi:MAG TPA: AAA family ATPase [Ramlibacter sp.]|uniref:bifunctional aminoglycoside phosphotransferase/ATP-binding protein n=1 Tax=Ramlibacter sp. TaxID=1917967 RepID=UPI002CD59097|nr:AAA family ATPase [Ramlibacter sp.]HVZ42229.1 AAA family ATPase [Ramlibacter sp.]
MPTSIFGTLPRQLQRDPASGDDAGPATPWPPALAQRLHAHLIETHISWVLLTRNDAYKFKKPIRLPFLDYSTLDRRKRCCEEEVRLNSRLAPSLYLGVSRITGTPDSPAIDSDGPVLDYAVHMRRFPSGALFSERASARTLTPHDADALGTMLARFHEHAPRAGTDTPTDPAATHHRARAALEGARLELTESEHAELRRWLDAGSDALLPLWMARRASGHVRECHGDLHLANIVEVEGNVCAFDSIEFDRALRCIDAMEDIAFTLMDFVARGHAPLGWRCIDAWLQATGDYEGLPVLRYALVYRALVRAQVEHLREDGGDAAGRYAATALSFARPRTPRLAITHGLPGSGKTYRSQSWLEHEGAIRIRSDVERKRLFGLGALQDSKEAGIDLYSSDATQQTYARLLDLARIGLRAGFPVVLDAAFLKEAERRAAASLARECDAHFAILDCKAPDAVLRQRLQARRGDASEADPQVLDRLRESAEPLTPAESRLAIG